MRRTSLTSFGYLDFSIPLHNSVFVLLVSWTVGAILEPLLRRFVNYRDVETSVFCRGRTYELIGVPVVRWIIVAGRLNCNPGLKGVKNGQIETLIETRKSLTIAEFAHWIGFAFMLVVIGASIVADVPNSVIASHFVVNVFGNAYLSLVQQYNRRRVDRLIARAERRGIKG